MGADADPSRALGFGHGKVILLGEHAVVYGQPALAAGLSTGVRATAARGTGRLRAPAWSLDLRVGDGSQVARALAAILENLEAPALDFEIDAHIPPRAGLGSSAALSVAVARAAAQMAGRSEDVVLAAAGAGEAVFHGSPSGVDAAAAASGAVGRFRRGAGWEAVKVLQPIPLCVGLSGRPRDTVALVEAVRRLRERAPVTGKVTDTLGAVVEAGVEAVGIGDIDGLGRLFNVAHGLLGALGVSTAELDAMVHGARAAGAIGAKLTGAGGGGAIIALAPGHERDVLSRWQRDGYDGFIAEIGGVR